MQSLLLLTAEIAEGGMSVVGILGLALVALLVQSCVMYCCVIPTGQLGPRRRRDVEAEDANNTKPFVKLFQSLREQVNLPSLEVEGIIPDWMTGSLVRTGPAIFEFGEEAFQHSFDGQAMLYSWTFSRGRVAYLNRLVDTANLRAHRAANRVATDEVFTDPCRTVFGRLQSTFFPSGEPYANPNVNVVVLGGKVVALTETPLPIEFEPETLATVGLVAFQDAPGSDCSGVLSTAHPHIDRGTAYNYVTRFGSQNVYVVYAIDQDAGAAGKHQALPRRVLATIPEDHPAYMHSFGITERYVVLSEWPTRYVGLGKLLKIIAQGRPKMDMFELDRKLGVQFTLVDRGTGEVTRGFRYYNPEATFGFHHVNAFDDPATGEVVVDIMCYSSADYNELFLDALKTADPSRLEGVATLSRFRLDVDARRVRRESLFDGAVELGRINPAYNTRPDYRYVYGLDGIVIRKVDVSKGASGNGEFGVGQWPPKEDEEAGRTRYFPTEPVFTPRPVDAGGTGQEDDGAVVSVVFDARAGRSFLLVLDARTMKEVGRAKLPHTVPFHFHGGFLPPAEAATAAATIRAEAAGAGDGAGAGSRS